MGETYTHIYFFMHGHFSEGCKAIINGFDLGGRKLGFWLSVPLNGLILLKQM